MQILPLDITSLYLVKTNRFEDSRGYLCETFRQDKFQAATGFKGQFIQDNMSKSLKKHTIRGLHYQSPPFDQGKLVRCSQGEVLDVAVDIRKNSKTYGQHYKTILSASNGHQLWIPSGFLHGFMTLCEDCDVAYKMTNLYSNSDQGAVFWNDPILNIDWGVNHEDAIISDKDKYAPLFTDFQSPF